MGAFDGACADVEGRADPLINGETFRADGGANDIDEGVDGSNFVEVDVFDAAVVDLGFGRAEVFEDANGRGFGCGGNVGGVDDLADFGETASVRVSVGVGWMRMRDRGDASFMAVAMRMCVGRRMRVRVCRLRSVGRSRFLLPEDLAREVFFSVGVDVDFSGGDAVAGDAGNFQFCAEVEGCDGFFEERGGDTGVEESAEKHVSADAGKTIEVGKAHRNRCSLIAARYSLLASAERSDPVGIKVRENRMARSGFHHRFRSRGASNPRVSS